VNKHVGRRGFFREGFRAFARTLADTASAVGGSAHGTKPIHKDRRVRPPGALIDTNAFLSACIGEECTECRDACPVDAIIPVPIGFQDHGTPVIIPSLQACVLCADIPCATVCPSGALVPPEHGAKDISLGMAALFEDTCLAYKGTFCVDCAHACPVEPRAIRINDHRRPLVDPARCTGCGACEQVCPTDPKSIRIDPEIKNPHAFHEAR